MKKGKKGLALAMTLAVTMTSVPTAFALDGNAQPTKQPDNQLGQRDTKAISYKYTKLDQAPMKESVQASSENTPMQWSEGPANLAFDGDVNTGWHTDYNTHQGPYTIEWNLGGTYKIGKVEYTRKKTGAAGIWKEIKIEVKNGETGSWQTAYNGTIAETADGASTDITFEPVDASDVKVTVVKSYDNPEGKYASAGEINVYSATKEVTLVNPIKILPEEGKTTTMKEGETQQFRYELTQEAEEAGGTVKWRVQDSSILKVDENGFVTAVSAGKGKVSANYKLGNTTYNTYIDVTVEKVETECTISLNGTQYKGMSLQEVVEQSKLTELTSVKFESGVIRDADFDYLKKFNRLQWTLKEFSIGDDVKLRGLSGDAIPLNAFYASYPGYNIEKVYLGKNVKGMGMNAFGMCRSLISFEAPGLEEMHTTALNRVNGLAELNLPSLKVVNGPLFGNMSNSTTETVKLPAVTELDDDAFKYLGALKTLELGATPPSLSISAGELKFAKGVVDNLKLVIPEGALDAYKASPGYNAEQNTWYGIKLSEPQEEVHINATINGTAVDGASLEKAVEKSGVAVDAVTSLTINSGKVTQEDLAYLKSISRLETFEMNVGDNLQLIGMDGQPTTVLSKDTAVIEFAPKRAGSSRADMTTLTLGGITEIYNGGLKAYDSIETIHMPDVVTVGASAFGLGAWLETLDLSSAKTIGANAFNGCKRLESLTMNAVETLGEGSFKYTDALDSLTLPATIKNIEDIRFGICKNGNKSGAKITILATTPPTVDSAAFTGVSSVTRPATVTVPQGALAAYVAQVNPKADVAKVLKRQDINWNSLYLREEGSSLVEYKAKCGTWADQYAYVATGQTITADKLAALHKDDQKNLKENEELKGWNTKKDGSGDMVTAETVVSEEMTVYPVIGEKAEEIHITAKVNGGESLGGETLAKVVEKANTTAEGVTSLVIESGKVTQDDLATLKSMTRLTNLEMNLDGDLELIGAEGTATTVLPAELFIKSSLETVSLAGFTEIGESAFKDTKYLESVTIPNVTVIGAGAFANTARLESIELPAVTEIGASAFARAQKLETVTMPSVVTIGASAFEHTLVEDVTLPATITSIGSRAFVGKPNGKRELHITIETATPPTIDGSFATHADAYVKVPDGSLGAYLPNLDLSKPFKNSGDTKWGGLRVIDNAQKLLTYHGVNSWDKMYAYVVSGTAITESRFPTTFENGDKILSGWNTSKDGTGTPVDANTVVTEDMTLYAQWSEPAVDLDVAVSYSNMDEAGETIWTNQDVTVTLTANEPVQDIEGWTRVSDTVLTKAYSQNGTYSVTVVSNDNQQKEVTYTVAGIDKQAPNVSVKGEGNGDRFRKITGIAVHDTEGVKELKVNDTVTEINSKYKYLTDIEKIGVKEGENTAVVVDQAGNEKTVTFHYDTVAPTFQWIVDNSKLEQSKEVRLETSEEIQLPGEGWSLKGQENGTYVYVKTFTANWKDKAFTVTDLAGNVSEPQFVEVKRIDNTKPAVVELTQDITDWTKKDVTVTIKTSVDCATPEGWKKVNKRTFTKVFTASGEYSVTLTSATGVTGDAYVFSITNIDKEAPVIDYAAIEAAKGYKREIPVNEGEEYTEEKLVEMFTKPEWVKDNSGTAAFKVDKWGLEHGLDGYQPFTSKTPGEYKVRFYAYDAAGNSSSFDVYVKVLEPEVEERTTTVNYTVFIDGRVRTGQWTHTGTETGEFRFDLSMVKNLPASYELEEGEEGYRMLQYGDMTSVTFYLTIK